MTQTILHLAPPSIPERERLLVEHGRLTANAFRYDSGVAAIRLTNELGELAEHPERHNVLAPGLAFDPEIVFYVDTLADAEGWAHTMQAHGDGSADYIAHRPSQLDHGVRWISLTPDQEALGMCLPATADPEGYHAEQIKGNLRSRHCRAGSGCRR